MKTGMNGIIPKSSDNNRQANRRRRRKHLLYADRSAANGGLDVPAMRTELSGFLISSLMALYADCGQPPRLRRLDQEAQ